MSYLTGQETQKKAPQSEPIPGREKDMQKNAAGGYVFTADSWTRLERFLILGSEGGTYYVGERELTAENVGNVRACIAQDGPRTVSIIRNISVSGRAPKNDPALYALALAASYGGDEKVRQLALDLLPAIARTGTHLFTFCAFIDTMRGWGPMLRKAVAAWYLGKTSDHLAYQLVKYQQRNGWSHRDVLTLAHPEGMNSSLFRWALGYDTKARKVGSQDGRYVRHYPYTPGVLPVLVQAFEEGKSADEGHLIQLIREHGLTREMIPTEHQKSPKVWEALLEKMPLTALIRTLGRMGSVGLLAPLSQASKEVVSRITDAQMLRAKRVHPIQVLSALLTYGQGHGQKGKLSWTPVPQVVEALNEAFYLAFENVEPTGKRFYLGVDVSGSMTAGTVAGVDGLTPNMGAAAMAMLIARTEPNYFIGGFSHTFVDLKITAKDRLDDAVRKCQRDFGGTDCATPIKHALKNSVPVGAFVVITDGMTWAGDIHAAQAIQDYRNKTGIDSKLIVMNMVANGTRVSDSLDSGSLDVVGFDASVPAVINQFLGVEMPHPILSY